MCRLYNLLNIFIFVRFIRNKIFDRKWGQRSVWQARLDNIIAVNNTTQCLTSFSINITLSLN